MEELRKTHSPDTDLRSVPSVSCRRRSMTWEVCGKSLIVFGYKLSSVDTVCLLKACFGRWVVRCFKL
jgi:hypothetical protein